MASDAQIRANQANAKRSTGPVTESGKAASAHNALRHGFRSQSVLLPGEDLAEYQSVLDTLLSLCGPADAGEERNVREMANAEWRLRRARAHQEILLTRKMGELAAARPEAGAIELQIAAYETLLAESAYFQQLIRWETKFERDYDRAWKLAQKTLASRQPPPAAAAKPGPRLVTNEPNSGPRVPRNAICPCGSGQKYKRCCGRGAPPVLGS